MEADTVICYGSVCTSINLELEVMQAKEFLLIRVVGLKALLLARRVRMVEGVMELSTSSEDGKIYEVHRRRKVSEMMGLES